jgi:DNA recombination protein RmuC
MKSIEIDPRWLEFGAPALLAGLVLGALMAWLFMRQRRRRLEAENAELRDRIKGQEALQNERDAAFQAASGELARSFSELANRSLQYNSETFLRLAEQKMSVQNEQAKRELSEREKAVENLVKPIREALQASQQQIEALERSRSEAYGSIRTQLEAMQAAQHSLTKETHNLAKALRRPEVRGRWGEITLRRLVELAGMVEHCDFVEQVHTVAEGQVIRPDMIVRMPDRRELVVDVKTPLDAYMQAVEAEDDAQRKLGLERHAKGVRAHIRMLSSKAYWEQFDESPEFVILFIPGDQFLSAAVGEIPSLLEDAIRQQVIIATPSSFVALLKAVAYGWRQDQLAENAARIQALGEDLYKRLATFSGYLARIGRSLGQSVDAYNSAVGSLERQVLPGARKFTELGLRPRRDIEELSTVDKLTRSPREDDGEEEPARNDQ